MLITELGPSGPIPHRGGYGTVTLAGEFNGATLRLEAAYPLDPGAWIPQLDVNGDAIAVTSDSSINFLTCPCDLRVVAADAAPTGVQFRVYPLPVRVFKIG